VLDRSIVLLERRNAVHRLIDLEEVPVTLAGISRHHIENALAATAASFGIGLPEDAVVRGLRSFVMNPDTNPGRANLFTLDGRIIVIDYAHNEAGMVGLTEILAGLRRGRAAVWLAFGTAGDRSDQILHALGYRAARGTDHVIVAELEHYLRGRDPEDLVRRLRAGAEDGGATEVPIMPDEVQALEWMLERSVGHDVVAVTALSQRPEVFGLLEDRGAVRADPETVRRLVRAARR
jgi:cyanophycin synthetase